MEIHYTQSDIRNYGLIAIIISLFFQSAISETTDQNQYSSNRYSHSVSGGVGLLQMPTARVAPDGEFVFGISSESPFNRLYSKVQFFPWMEAVLRYTESTSEPYNPGSKQTWKDKGIDIKFRIFKESEKYPEVSIGLRDFGGTGAYSSEYLVATKSFQNFDMTAGFGWGALSGTKDFDNFFGWIDENRKTRGGGSVRGGKIRTGQFFSGEHVSVFGGLEYYTPLENLTLKIEYDSTNYSRVDRREKKFFQTGDIFSIDSRLNYALNYKVNVSDRDTVDLSFGYLRGNTIYANMSVSSNLNFSGKKRFFMGAEKLKRTDLKPYQDLNKEWKKYLTERIIWQLGNVGFVTHNLSYGSNEIVAELSQGRFQKPIHFFDLASRIIANNAPVNIQKITIVNIDQGIETLRASIDREDLEKSTLVGAVDESVFIYDERPNNQEELFDIATNEYLYPNFYWEIKPHMLGTLQHQEKFYFWQLEALIHTEYSIMKGLVLSTDIGLDIANNYDDYTYHVPDGKLHHVRQDRRRYLTEGKSGLRRMSMDYLFDVNANIKGRVSAGILEWMYGGLGTEFIYFPNSRRWAVSTDLYWVKQRDFDQRLSFKDYSTVTGFVSFYRDIPFYNLRLKMSAGKFLGKDVGARIDISRRFETGARVGGMVALTDCDSACVGEGSFNKWIYFELPMDLFYTQSNTRARTGYAWSPLTKDAGQKVETLELYNLVMNASNEVDHLREKQWSIKKIFSGFSRKQSSER